MFITFSGCFSFIFEIKEQVRVKWKWLPIEPTRRTEMTDGREWQWGHWGRGCSCGFYNRFINWLGKEKCCQSSRGWRDELAWISTTSVQVMDELRCQGYLGLGNAGWGQRVVATIPLLYYGSIKNSLYATTVTRLSRFRELRFDWRDGCGKWLHTGARINIQHFWHGYNRTHWESHLWWCCLVYTISSLCVSNTVLYTMPALFII